MLQAFKVQARQNNIKLLSASAQPFEDRTPFFVAKTIAIDYLEALSPNPDDWPDIITHLVTEDARQSTLRFFGTLLGLKGIMGDGGADFGEMRSNGGGGGGGGNNDVPGSVKEPVMGYAAARSIM